MHSLISMTLIFSCFFTPRSTAKHKLEAKYQRLQKWFCLNAQLLQATVLNRFNETFQLPKNRPHTFFVVVFVFESINLSCMKKFGLSEMTGRLRHYMLITSSYYFWEPVHSFMTLYSSVAVPVSATALASSLSFYLLAN